MKVSVEFEIERLHCLDCPLREQTGWNNCVLQKDINGYFIYFDDWKEQMKNCPLKEVKQNKTKQKDTWFEYQMVLCGREG